MAKDNILTLMNLFDGNENVYGLYYNIPDRANERGKKKGTAKVTVKSGNKSVKVTVKVK